MRKPRLVAIPVRGSKTVLRILPRIAAWADSVTIYATEVEFEPSEIPSNVLVTEAVPGLADARQAAALWASCEGADYIFQIDDDTDIDFSVALYALWETLEDFPFLGAVCTMPELLAFYNRERRSNMEFLCDAFPKQVWGLRISSWHECDGIDRVPTMEDLYLGLDLWEAGYACATLPHLQHRHIRPRLTNKRTGGTPPSERDPLMLEAGETIRERFGGTVLKHLRIAAGKNGILKLQPRYNWKEMGQRVQDRWGPIGYSDGRLEF